MKRMTATGLILILAAIVCAAGFGAGCGGTTTTATVTTPAATVTQTGTGYGAQTTTGQGSSGSSAALSKYEPSTVVSDNPGSLQLSTADSVQQVTAFYDSQLTQGGWNIISDSKTDYSTNITATKGNTGTTLSISATANGCYISIVTYPV